MTDDKQFAPPMPGEQNPEWGNASSQVGLAVNDRPGTGLNLHRPSQDLSAGRDKRLAANRLLTVLGAYFPEAGRMFAANLPVLGWATAIYLLISVSLLAALGVLMRLIGSPWPALVLVALVLVGLVLPLVRLTVCHLALNIWDDGEASLLEAAAFARGNYLDALGACWNGLIYEGYLWLRLVACSGPGLAVGAGLHWLLPYSGVSLGLGWEILIVALLTAILAGYYLWDPARRVSTFLYRFNAFEIVDGQSVFSQDIVEGSGGHWRSRFARMYYHLDQEPFPYEFNLPLAVVLATALVWLLPSAGILSADLQPLSKIYLLAIGPFLIRFIFGLWYTIASAGYYRANLAPEDSRYGR